jgi:hypothetical protein
MVTNNQEGIKGKDVVTIVRVGGIIIIINPRTTLIMRNQIIMLVRERKKGER